MQVVKSKYIADIILWYWAKMYSASIDKGETYDATKRAVCILIADFKLDNLYDIPKFNIKWQIREEEYKNIVLTNKLELYIIELTKLEENIGKTDNVGLINWCKFIKNPEKVSDSIMKENEYIKRAKEELDEISQNDYDRRMAELREKAILDELMYRKSGYEEGKEEGIEEGRTKEKENIAKIMLKKKIDIKTICEITGLAEEEIRKL